MVFTSVGRARRHRAEAAVTAGAWAAVAVMAVAWNWYQRDPRSHSSSWSALSLAAGTVTAALITLVVTEAVRARHGDIAKIGKVHVVGLVLAGLTSLAGLFLFLGHVVIDLGTSCSGTSAACSWACLNRSGQSLGWLLALTAALAPTTLITLGRRSRTVAWSAPALVLALYLLAFQLSEPHGTRTRCIASDHPCRPPTPTTQVPGTPAL